MQILGHRGYHANEPENTLGAFEQAVKMGMDGIETDVRLSRDGHLVLLHDHLFPDGRPVNESTRREMEECVGYSIPTLGEALDAWENIYWNIEIKTRAALDPAISILKQYCPTRDLLVTSFQHDLIARCSKLLEADFGLIFSHRPMDLFLETRERYPRVKNLVLKYEILDQSLIRQARDAGFRLFVYGMKNLWEHKHCVEMEVDGIITDYPEFAGLSTNAKSE